MSKFNRRTSQDFGQYLPDDEAILQEENILIQASNYNEAQKICEDEAKHYDGFDAEAQKVENTKKDYNCRFTFWA